MAYRAVLFDFFGTLTTAIDAPSPTVATARALGCDPAAFADLLRRTYPALARGEYGDPATSLRRLAWELGRSPSPDQVQAAVLLRTEAIASVIRLRADAAGTLRRLRAAGLRTGVVSDCSPEVPAIVARLTVAPLWDCRVFSCELGASKPDPRLYLTAAHRLRVHPNECLYVGDGGADELPGAVAVGMTAVQLRADDSAAHHSHAPGRPWAGPVVAHLADIVDHLGAALVSCLAS